MQKRSRVLCWRGPISLKPKWNRPIWSCCAIVPIVWLLIGLSACTSQGDRNSAPPSPVISPNQSLTQQTVRPLAWALGSQLSLAIALTNANAPAASIQAAWAKAQASATRLNLEPISLPRVTGDRNRDAVTLLEYLLQGQGANYTNHLRATHGEDAANLYELAVKSQVLVMLYSPGDPLTSSLIERIGELCQTLSLPAERVAPLLKVVKSGQSYETVKKAVSAFHQQVADDLTN
jgi:hypothetical protein